MSAKGPKRLWWTLGGVVALGLLALSTVPLWMGWAQSALDAWQVYRHWPKHHVLPRTCHPVDWGGPDWSRRSLVAFSHSSDGRTQVLVRSPKGSPSLETTLLDPLGTPGGVSHVDLPQGWVAESLLAGPVVNPVVHARCERKTDWGPALFGRQPMEAMNDALKRALGPSWEPGTSLALDETHGLLVAVRPGNLLREKGYRAVRRDLIAAAAPLEGRRRGASRRVGVVTVWSPRYRYPHRWSVEPTLAVDARGRWWAAFGDTLFVSRDAGRTWRVEHRFPEGNVRDVCPCADGRVWAAYVGKYTEENGVWLSRAGTRRQVVRSGFRHGPRSHPDVRS
jgi:hypothetical protein